MHLTVLALFCQAIPLNVYKSPNLLWSAGQYRDQDVKVKLRRSPLTLHLFSNISSQLVQDRDPQAKPSLGACVPVRHLSGQGLLSATEHRLQLLGP